MKKQRVWFRHGKIIKGGFHCPWCDCMRTGRVVKETFRWRVIMSCGHVRANVGFTLPPSELERKGYINQKGTEDPRFTAKKKHLFAAVMAQRAEALRRKRIAATLGGGRDTL